MTVPYNGLMAKAALADAEDKYRAARSRLNRLRTSPQAPTSGPVVKRAATMVETARRALSQARSDMARYL